MSGLPQVEVRLRQVLADLAEDLRGYSVGPDAAWPGLLVVERMVQVWCVDDGSVPCVERVLR